MNNKIIFEKNELISHDIKEFLKKLNIRKQNEAISKLIDNFSNDEVKILKTKTLDLWQSLYNFVEDSFFKLEAVNKNLISESNELSCHTFCIKNGISLILNTNIISKKELILNNELSFKFLKKYYHGTTMNTITGMNSVLGTCELLTPSPNFPYDFENDLFYICDIMEKIVYLEIYLKSIYYLILNINCNHIELSNI